MKIGILTYHRAENYGALLQAYALRTYLQSLDHEVEFVDYWPDYHEDYFRIFPVRKFKSGNIITKAACLYMASVWRIARIKRKHHLQQFMFEQLGLPKNPKYTSEDEFCDEFDVVVYGSDQIWRKQNMPGHKGFDYWYFGSENVKSRKVSYAGSMGVIQTNKDEDAVVKHYLEKFAALSVREASLKSYFATLGLQSVLVSDPVFLLSADAWRNMYATAGCNIKRSNYILYYNLLNSKDSTLFANQLSREKRLPIIEITKKYSVRVMGKRYNRSATVPEFLSLVDHAEYVVSNSFHGVAMSIIFRKQFWAVGMGEKSGRVESLLKILNIENRYIAGNHKISFAEIDYEKVANRMTEMIEESQCYLKNEVLDA